MTQRYYLPATYPSREGEFVRLNLDDEESRHLNQVMRVKAGERVVVFNGEGDEAEAIVAAIRRSSVELDVSAARQGIPELGRDLVLAVAFPKGDRQKVLLEKLVELGVTSVVPISTKHSVAEATHGAMARWRRTVVEASKQCGRNRLMRVEEPVAWKSFVSEPRNHPQLLADSTGKTLTSPRLQELCCQQSVLLAIGPEGGWEPEELSLAKNFGWELVAFGPRTLRVETAAITGAVLLGNAAHHESSGHE